jgi:serpin B
MLRMTVCLTAASALLLACAPTLGGGEEAEASEEAAQVGQAGGGAPLDRIVGGNTRFALHLYREIKGDGNLFFSPYSVSAALAMTYAGARGETEREMAEVLGFPTVESPDEAAATAIREEVAAVLGSLEERLEAEPETRGYALHVANALWGQFGYPFLESYVAFVDEHLDAPLTLLDFVRETEASRQRINAWVEERTRERIKDLIPEGGVGEATRLVLTNAVYFKGDWAEEFNAKRTRDADFRGLSDTTTVAMMTRKGDFGYFENEEAQVLEMPYEGGDLSMVVLLPKVGGAAGLGALERALTPENLDAWIGAVHEREVTVHVPRFTMTWGSIDLKDHLEALGMRRAFSEGAADFTGMSEARDLFITGVFHKAFVEVNEQGTEAAAATGVVMAKTSIAPPLVFRADHPFVFMIRDLSTGSILFLGRITDLGE